MTASMQAVCAVAGWPYCNEHDRPRYDGLDPCERLHPQPVRCRVCEDWGGVPFDHECPPRREMNA